MTGAPGQNQPFLRVGKMGRGGLRLQTALDGTAYAAYWKDDAEL